MVLYLSGSPLVTAVKYAPSHAYWPICLLRGAMRKPLPQTLAPGCAPFAASSALGLHLMISTQVGIIHCLHRIQEGAYCSRKARAEVIWRVGECRLLHASSHLSQRSNPGHLWHSLAFSASLSLPLSSSSSFSSSSPSSVISHPSNVSQTSK